MVQALKRLQFSSIDAQVAPYPPGFTPEARVLPVTRERAVGNTVARLHAGGGVSQEFRRSSCQDGSGDVDTSKLHTPSTVLFKGPEVCYGFRCPAHASGGQS